MLRRDWQLETLVVLVVLAASAWSQTARYTVPAASVGDDFSVYHQALDSAADLALANIAREAGNNHITGLMPMARHSRAGRFCTILPSSIGMLTRRACGMPSLLLSGEAQFGQPPWRSGNGRHLPFQP